MPERGHAEQVAIESLQCVITTLFGGQQDVSGRLYSTGEGESVCGGGEVREGGREGEGGGEGKTRGQGPGGGIVGLWAGGHECDRDQHECDRLHCANIIM